MNDISDAFTLAQSYYTAGMYDEAFALYEKLSVMEPENYMLLYEMGLVLVRMHEFEHAREFFARSVMESQYCYRTTVSGKCLYSSSSHIDREECVYPNISEMKKVDEYLAAGNMCYANYYRLKACPDCSRCLPFRVDVAGFNWSGSVLRTVRRNRDMHVQVCDDIMITPEKIELYKHYMTERHGETDLTDPERSLALRHYGFFNTLEMNYFLGSKLIAVGLCVTGKESIYSGFFYHDPSILKRRPGFYSMYMELALAVQNNIKWYYPGWYVEGISNMEYKRELSPAQVLINGEWRPFSYRK